MEACRKNLEKARKAKGPVTDEIKAKISATLKGRTLSKETKEKISQTLKGKRKGVKLTDEQKQKISDGVKKYWES